MAALVARAGARDRSGGARALLRIAAAVLRDPALHRGRRRAAAHRERQGAEVQAARARRRRGDVGPRKRVAGTQAHLAAIDGHCRVHRDPSVLAGRPRRVRDRCGARARARDRAGSGRSRRAGRALRRQRRRRGGRRVAATMRGTTCWHAAPTCATRRRWPPHSRAPSQRFGTVDVMVNNAARTPSASIWDVDGAEWDDVLAVNLRGTFFGCRIAGAPHARARSRPHRQPRVDRRPAARARQPAPHYAASKAGIVALTRAFAAELAPHGVTVNAVAPSAIESPLLDQLPADAVREHRGGDAARPLRPAG